MFNRMSLEAPGTRKVPNGRADRCLFVIVDLKVSQVAMMVLELLGVRPPIILPRCFTNPGVFLAGSLKPENPHSLCK